MTNRTADISLRKAACNSRRVRVTNHDNSCCTGLFFSTYAQTNISDNGR